MRPWGVAGPAVGGTASSWPLSDAPAPPTQCRTSQVGPRTSAQLSLLRAATTGGRSRARGRSAPGISHLPSKKAGRCLDAGDECSTNAPSIEIRTLVTTMLARPARRESFLPHTIE